MKKHHLIYLRTLYSERFSISVASFYQSETVSELKRRLSKNNKYWYRVVLKTITQKAVYFYT